MQVSYVSLVGSQSTRPFAFACNTSAFAFFLAQAELEKVVAHDGAEHWLCPKCNSFVAECLGHIPLHELMQLSQQDPDVQYDIDEGRKNRDAGSVDFAQESVGCADFQDATVHRQVIIMNDAEWAREFGSPPLKRETRFIPKMNIINELGEAEEVYIFKWEPTHLRVLTLSCTRRVQKSSPKLDAPSHWYERQSEQVYRFAMEEARRDMALDSLAKNLGSVAARKSKAMGGDEEEGDEIEGGPDSSPKGALLVSPQRPHGVAGTRAATASAAGFVARVPRRSSPPACSAVGPRVGGSVLSAPSQALPQRASDDGETLPEDSASQVGGEVPERAGKDDDAATIWIKRLPLDVAMSVGKLGVQEHHAKMALKKMQGDQARKLKGHLKLYTYATQLLKDQMQVMQESECHEALSKLIANQTPIHPAVHENLVEWRARLLQPRVHDSAGIDSIIGVTWPVPAFARVPREGGPPLFDVYNPRNADLSNGMADKVKNFVRLFVDEVLVKMFASGVDEKQLVHMAISKLQAKALQVVSSGEEVDPDLEGLCCEIHSLHKCIGLILKPDSIWKEDEVDDAIEELSKLANSKASCMGTGYILEQVSEAIGENTFYKEKVHLITGNQAKILELLPELCETICAMESIEDKNDVDENSADCLIQVLRCIPKIVCSLNQDMASGTEALVKAHVARFADNGRKSLATSSMSREQAQCLLKLLTEASAAMPFEGSLAHAKAEFEAALCNMDDAKTISELETKIEAVNNSKGEATSEDLSSLESLMALVGSASLPEKLMTKCDALFSNLLKWTFSSFPNAQASKLLRAAESIQEPCSEQAKQKGATSIPALTDGLALHDALSQLKSKLEGQTATKAHAELPEMTRMQVLLQRVEEAIKEKSSQVDSAEAEAYAKKLREVIEQARGLELEVGNQVFTHAVAEVNPKFDELKLTRFGAADGSDWMAGLSTAQKGQWKALLAKAEQTIMKEQKVAKLRAPMNAAAQDPLATHQCLAISCLTSSWGNTRGSLAGYTIHHHMLY